MPKYYNLYGDRSRISAPIRSGITFLTDFFVKENYTANVSDDTQPKESLLGVILY